MLVEKHFILTEARVRLTEVRILNAELFQEYGENDAATEDLEIIAA